MVIESCLAKIHEVRDGVCRGREPKILFMTDHLGLWLELRKESLEILMDCFGVGNYRDLVGRECTIKYETGPFKFFSEGDIKSIVPYTKYTEADFVEIT